MRREYPWMQQPGNSSRIPHGDVTAGGFVLRIWWDWVGQLSTPVESVDIPCLQVEQYWLHSQTVRQAQGIPSLSFKITGLMHHLTSSTIINFEENGHGSFTSPCLRAVANGMSRFVLYSTVQGCSGVSVVDHLQCAPDFALVSCFEVCSPRVGLYAESY